MFTGARGAAISAMQIAFERYPPQQNDVGAVLALGGSGNTALITPAMRALPIGVPKLMVRWRRATRSSMSARRTSP